MSLHFLLFLLSHLNLSVKVVLIGSFITHCKTIHSEQNFLWGINRYRETAFPSSSLNYPATAEQWSGGQHVTRTRSDVPRDGSIILEVTLCGLQRTAGWLQGSLANTSLLNLYRPGSKEWGGQGKSRSGPAAEKVFQKVTLRSAAALRAATQSDLSSLHWERRGQNLSFTASVHR